MGHISKIVRLQQVLSASASVLAPDQSQTVATFCNPMLPAIFGTIHGAFDSFSVVTGLCVTPPSCGLTLYARVVLGRSVPAKQLTLSIPGSCWW